MILIDNFSKFYILFLKSLADLQVKFGFVPQSSRSRPKKQISQPSFSITFYSMPLNSVLPSAYGTYILYSIILTSKYRFFKIQEILLLMVDQFQ